MSTILFVFITLFYSGPINQSDFGYRLAVKVNGLKNDKGTVIINIYSSPEGFPGDRLKSFQSIRVKPKNLEAEAVYAGIPRGTYAIAVMHDENNNGKMDRNAFGIPKEGYCVSNNVRGFLSAPAFNQAKFQLNSATVLNLKMIN